MVIKIDIKKQASVSVIIPVFNDLVRLEKCIEKIANQSYPKSLMEIIIIDNGSDNYQEIHDKFTKDNVRVVQELSVGSYSARNKGIDISNNDVLVFTDSDCVPDVDWIRNGINSMGKHPNGLIFGGNVNVFRNDEGTNISELYDYVTAFPQREYIERLNFSVTANLFTYKSTFNKYGKFNSTIKSGGDSEWCNRVINHRNEIVYMQDAIVSHPARSSLKSLVKKYKRIAGGEFDKSKNNIIKRIVYTVKNLMPPIQTFKIIIKSEKIGFFQRILLLLYACFLKIIRSLEFFRLFLGKDSYRA